MQDFDDSGTPADGRSTAAASGAGTPMSSGNPGPRLRLTVNNNSSSNNRDGYVNGGTGGMVSDDE